jgi:hypothetical protein
MMARTSRAARGPAATSAGIQPAVDCPGLPPAASCPVLSSAWRRIQGRAASPARTRLCPDGLWQEPLALLVQPGQALLDHAEEIVRALSDQTGRGLPFKHHEQAGAGLLATADQLLGLGEQERAQNGGGGDVHAASQERAQRRLVP